MTAIAAPKCGKDIAYRPRIVPLPALKHCPKCGGQFDRSLVPKTQRYCSPCKRQFERDRKHRLALASERKRVLDAVRDLTREGNARRDALNFIDEFIRLYHGPVGLAARLQELDADLRAKGDLANQARLFEAVLAVLSRASVTD